MVKRLIASEGLAQGLTRRLEVDSSLEPSGFKATTPPLHHRAPHNRVPEAESLFNYNSANPPKCGEPYIVPTCDCYKGQGENSINVTCPQPKQSNLLKTGYRCETQQPGGTNETITVPQPTPIGPETGTVDPGLITTSPLPNNKTDGTVTPVWPTPLNQIDEPQARKACEDAMTSSPLYSTCSEKIGVARQRIIDDCVIDIQIADDLSPAKSVEGQLERICTYTVEILITITPNGYTPETDKPWTELLDQICLNQCSNRGKCEKRVCVCDTGYIGSDCSLTQGYVPEIRGVLSPDCIISSDNDCSKVYVRTTDPLTGYLVSCRIKNSAGEEKTDSSPIVSGGVVICSLPFEVVPGTYQVAISIDGTTFGVYVEFSILPAGATAPPATVLIPASITTGPPPPGETTPAVPPTPTQPIGNETPVPTPGHGETTPAVPPTSTPAIAGPTTVPIVPSCPDFGSMWAEFAKTTPPGSDQCPDLAAMGDAVVKCINASVEKAKPTQARK